MASLRQPSKTVYGDWEHGHPVSGYYEASVTIDLDAEAARELMGSIETLTFQSVVNAIACYAPWDAPHAVIGMPDGTEAPAGVLVVFFLEVPDAQQLRRFRESVESYLPVYLYIDYRWSRCVKHDDCRDVPEMGRACRAATSRESGRP